MAKAKYPIIAVWEDGARPGSWLVRVTTGPGQSLRRRATSREAAEAKGEEIAGRLRDGLNVAGGDGTLAAFIDLWWEQAILPRGLAPSTLKSYRQTIELSILPAIGTKPLQAVDVPTVIAMATKVRREVSASAAYNAVRRLSMILNAARRWKYVRYNAAADAWPDLPSYTAKERMPLDDGEIARLMASMRGQHYELAVETALLLGLRAGELFGLQWVDIDWQQATLAVRRQAQGFADQRVRETTKTSTSHRTLPIPPLLLERLRQSHAAGPRSVFVFPNTQGRMTVPTTFNALFSGGHRRKRADAACITRRAQIRSEITPHYLRHTAATRLMVLGVVEEVRSAILGHARKSITQHYSHVTMGLMRRAVEAWEVELHQLVGAAGVTGGDTDVKKSAEK